MEPIINPSDEVPASLFLDAATAAVRNACGWHIAPSLELSGSLRSNGGRFLRLPCRHVTGVSELVARHGADLMPMCQWDEDGLIELDQPIEPGLAAVRFRVTAGYRADEIPVVVAVISQAARRAASVPGGYVRSESVNGASVSYALGSSGAPAVSLLPDELSALAPFMIARLP